MLIYTKNLDWERLKRNANNPDKVTRMVIDSIPSWASHIKNIQNNQRYYAAVYLRNVLAIPFKTRMALVNTLTEGIAVTGLTAYFVSIEELIDYCDKDKLLSALKELYNAQDIY